MSPGYVDKTHTERKDNVKSSFVKRDRNNQNVDNVLCHLETYRKHILNTKTRFNDYVDLYEVTRGNQQLIMLYTK